MHRFIAESLAQGAAQFTLPPPAASLAASVPSQAYVPLVIG